MRRIIITIMVLTTIAGSTGSFGQNDPSKWSSGQLEKWFNSGEWHKGWNVKPDQSINKGTMARAYFKNPDRWNKAFEFLRGNDLTKLELKRYDIDGDNLFIMISEYNTKDPETARFEAHKKYIDIQYVVTGSELMNIAPLTSGDSILQKYDPVKDIEFLSVKKASVLKAGPDRFFIFFPEDAHRPGLKENVNAPVRKAVVKVKID
jgi:YhcH/YjgK/YiaL family protein